jgi:hypothetical protein
MIWWLMVANDERLIEHHCVVIGARLPKSQHS